MKSVFATLSLVFCLACAACAMQPVQDPATADYGAPPPAGYEDMVKSAFENVIYETKTTIYQFEPPVKAYTTRNRYIDRQKFGWAVCGTVKRQWPGHGYRNAYGDTEPFFVLFQNGRIADKLIGAHDSVLGDTIEAICHRK